MSGIGSNYYTGNAFSSGSVGANAGLDFNSIGNLNNYAKTQSAAMLDKYLNGSSTTQAFTSTDSMKADTAAYLDRYVLNMSNLSKSADLLRNGGIDKLLYDREGNVTDETIEKTVDAVQSMIDEYNNNVKFLDKNASRGSGTTDQLGRMVKDPMSEKSMEMIGLSVNKDGTLALDKEKLTEAFNAVDELTGGVNTLQRDLIKDLIGGNNGLANSIKRTADAGLNISAQKLINSDLSNIQSNSGTGYYAEMFNSIKGGAYAMNNQGALNMMNFTV